MVVEVAGPGGDHGQGTAGRAAGSGVPDVGWRVGRLSPGVQRHEGGEPGCHGPGEHGGAVAGCQGAVAGSVHGAGDRGQQRRSEGGAQLPAGVDNAADQALVAVGDARAGRDHAAERHPGRAEPD
jgi:hypothetical protein